MHLCVCVCVYPHMGEGQYVCVCVCACLYILRRDRWRNRLILSPLTESLTLSCLEVSWLFSCIISASPSLRRHVLMSSGGDDQRSGSCDEVIKAILHGCTGCEFMELLCCVIISCHRTRCQFPVITPWNLEPRRGLCAGQWVGRRTERECMKWGQEGSKLLTGLSA